MTTQPIFLKKNADRYWIWINFVNDKGWSKYMNLHLRSGLLLFVNSVHNFSAGKVIYISLWLQCPGVWRRVCPDWEESAVSPGPRDQEPWPREQAGYTLVLRFSQGFCQVSFKITVFCWILSHFFSKLILHEKGMHLHIVRAEIL